jgi:nickel/cobalt transporter (NicO) family protein
VGRVAIPVEPTGETPVPQPNAMSISKRTTLILLCVLSGAMFVSAHPLGNFTINHFARLDVFRERIRVHYVIDMAEIPSFQELQKLGTSSAKEILDAYALRVTGEFPANLVLKADGNRLPLKVVSRNLVLAEGAAGMQTLRIECDLESFLPQTSTTERHLEFQDNNYAERIGWREIVVSPQAPVSVFDSNVFAGSLSDELRNYPRELMAAPLVEREAEFSFTTGVIPTTARPLQTRHGSVRVSGRDRLAELIAVPRLTFQVALLGLLFAAFLGAVHAMSPGHGKAIVAAYLVGSRGTARHAVFLGLTVTITHTAGVFVLGLATLVASQYIVPEQLVPKLSLISGLVVVVVGLNLLMRRLRTAVTEKPVNDSHRHTHAHGGIQHDHEHDGEHSHLPPGSDGAAVTWRSLLALGVSGGILPCPSALVVLLAAISLHRVGYGLVLVVAFSAGLAATLTTVGLLFIYAGRWLKGRGQFYRITRVLPVASALVIVTAGLAICYAALDQSGYSVSEVINQLSARLAG